MLQELTKKQKILVGVILLASLVLVLYNGIHQPSQSKGVSEQKDKTTGETIRTIEGENESLSPDDGVPIFLGVTTVLDHGISSQQLGYLKTGLRQFSTINALGIKKYSINDKTYVSGVVDQDTPSETNQAKFDIVADDKTTYKVDLRYQNLEQTEVYINDSSGKLLFDSGVFAPGR